MTRRSRLLGSGGVKTRLMNTRLGDLIGTPAGEGIWREVIAQMPAATIMGLACGNTLIARKT